MVWFPVDDAFHGHPKTRKAGLEAVGLWTVSGSFCMAYLTDGFVPEWFVKSLPRGLAMAKRLVEANLWYVGECDGERGFWFHDWKPWCTKEHVLAARENARQRKAKSRESHVTSRVTDAVSPWPIQSNPIQSNTLVTSSGELTQVEPPTFCPRHPTGTEKPCGACADARRTHEAWTQTQTENQLAHRRRLRQERESCQLCDENGMRETACGLTRCEHHA